MNRRILDQQNKQQQEQQQWRPDFPVLDREIRGFVGRAAGDGGSNRAVGRDSADVRVECGPAQV